MVLVDSRHVTDEEQIVMVEARTCVPIKLLSPEHTNIIGRPGNVTADEWR